MALSKLLATLLGQCWPGMSNCAMPASLRCKSDSHNVSGPQPSVTPSTSLVSPLLLALCHPDRLTRVVAMDCEMVGTGADGSRSVLARVSIVSEQSQTLKWATQ